MRHAHERSRWKARNILCALALSLAGAANQASAQVAEPAFTADSPVAESTLNGLPGLLARGGEREAARALQDILDGEAGRVVRAQPGDELWTDARARVHAALLDRPDLLALYAEQEEPRARRMLESGRAAEVERTRLLTPAGFEACLRVGQARLEAGDFDGAALVLLQLEAHPQRSGPAGADAARLLGLVAGYADREDLRAHAERWADETGIELRPPRGITLPPALARPRLDTLRPAPAADIGGMVPRPLNAVPLPIVADLAVEGSSVSPQAIMGSQTDANAAWVLPATSGDALIISDGVGIASYDRYTLREHWSHRYTGLAVGDGPVRGAIRAAPRRTADFDDAGTVAISGDTVVAAAGVGLGGTRTGDRALYAFDLQTGDVLWAVNPTLADAALEAGAISGPPAISGDTVVVAVRQAAGLRRLTSLSLVGLSLADGSLRWITPIGSVGAVPYQSTATASSAMLVDRGVIYRSDDIGLVAAIEAATGRPRWIRRFVPRPAVRFATTPPYAIDQPLLADGELLTLSPNRLELVRIDPETGSLIGQRPTAPISTATAEYLVKVGEHLAVMSGAGASFLDIPPTAETPVRLAGLTQGELPVGRAMAVGGELAIPTQTGLALVDPVSPERVRRLALDVTGNALLTDGQVIVADATGLHSYLVWDAARELLRSRMQRQPNDPDPAITFADLAFRAGQQDEILPAVRHAASAIETAADPEGPRARLLGALMAMISASVAAPSEGAADRDPGARSISDAALVRELIQQAERLADGEEEIVAVRVALGRLEQNEGNTRAALRVFQDLLADDTLAATTWRGGRLAVAAELEATRRIVALLEASETDPYAAFDAGAAARLAATDDGDPRALERVARAYPVARTAPEAWLAVAEAERAGDRTHAAVRALRSGLDAAREVERLRGIFAEPEAAKLGGELVVALAESGRIHEARDILGSLRTSRPELVLIAGGQPVDTAALLADLDRQIAAGPRTARIGLKLIDDAEPVLLSGYLLQPLAEADRSDGDPQMNWPDGAMMVSPMSSTVSWIEPDAQAGARIRWSVPIDREPILLQRDESSVWLLLPDDQGGRVTRLALADGARIWTTPSWPVLIGDTDREDAPWDGPRGLAQLPREGRVPLSQIVVVPSRRTITMTDRMGRAVSLDASDGSTRWSAQLPLSRVFDIDLADGLLVAAGPSIDSPNPDAGLDGMVVILDAATGDRLGTVTGPRLEPRWVHLIDRTTLIVGTELSLLSVAIPRGDANWEMTDPPAPASSGGRLVGSMLWISDADGRTWPVEPGTGRRAGGPIDGAELSPRADWRRITRTGDRVAVSTPRGITIATEEGRVLAQDGLFTRGELTPAVLAGDLLVTLESVTRRLIAGGVRHELHLLDARGAELLASTPINLYARPRTIAVIDGAILVDAGDVVMVARAPIED